MKISSQTYKYQIQSQENSPWELRLNHFIIRNHKMEQMFDKFFDSIANLFGGGDSIPWCDRDVIHVSAHYKPPNAHFLFVSRENEEPWRKNETEIWVPLCSANPIWFGFCLLELKTLECLWIVGQGCEKEVAEANKGDSDELKSESIMRLSWALVHSKQPEDVQRGIAMLEGIIIILINISKHSMLQVFLFVR